MDAYKIRAIVKNGQLIIDLPAEFDNTEVEIVISHIVAKPVSGEESKLYMPDSKDSSTLEEPELLVYQKPLVKPIHEVDESGFIPPRQKVDFSKLQGRMSKESVQKMIEDIEDANDSDYWQPREIIDLSTLIGTLKLNMTIDEIDSLTKSWRDEWN